MRRILPGMTVCPEDLANSLGISGKRLRGWLRNRFPRPVGRKGSAWALTVEQVTASRLQFGGATARKHAEAKSISAVKTGADRCSSDEAYVIDLCDQILAETALRQHTFDWLIGDPGRGGSCRCLPVDAYYQRHALVIEYRERQHEQPVAFFDRRSTISGIGRGEQRRLYDRRREVEIPKHGLRLVIVTPNQLGADRRGRLRRDRTSDLTMLRALLPR